MFRKILYAFVLSSLVGVLLCQAQETTLRGTWQFDVQAEDGEVAQYTLEIVRDTASSLTYRLYKTAGVEDPVLAAAGFIIKDREAEAPSMPVTYRLHVPGKAVGHVEALSFEGRASEANDLLEGTCRQGSRTFSCQMIRVGEGS